MRRETRSCAKQRSYFISASGDAVDQIERCATYGRQQLAQKIHAAQVCVENGEVSRVVVRDGHDPEDRQASVSRRAYSLKGQR